MALLRRAPREVYRVLSESDYLADADAGELPEPVTAEVGGRPRLKRIVGFAMLVGVVAAVAAMLMMHGRPSPEAPRTPRAASGGAPAAGPRTTGGAGSGPPGRRQLPRHAARRRRRHLVAPRSGRFAPSVRASSERSPRAPGGSSAQPEQAEFSFER